MLILCFKNLVLGKLEYKDGYFFYTSSKKGEQQFLQSYPLAVLYNLEGSKNKKLDVLPIFLKQYLDCAKNPFYIKQAGIKNDFDDFEKLSALSKLNFDRNDFYLKTIEKVD